MRNKIIQLFFLLSCVPGFIFSMNFRDFTNSAEILFDLDTIVYKTNIDTISVNVKIDKSESFLEILNIIKNLLTIISILVALYFGHKTLSRKLIEEHVTKKILQIQEENKIANNSCQILIDKYKTQLLNTRIITNDEIQDIFNDISNLYNKSMNTSKEVVTYNSLLKRTLQGVLRQYNKQSSYRISSDELYSLVIETLEHMVYFSTKIVNIPHNFSKKRINYIKKELKPFVDRTKYRSLKYFDVGVDERKTSPVYIAFYNYAMRSNSFLILRAAYNAVGFPGAVGRVLFFNKIYFPVILKSKTEDRLMGYFYYHLVGFNKKENVYSGNIEYVFHYANINEGIRFTNTIKPDELFEKFNDCYISSKNIEKKEVRITRYDLENFTVKIPEDVLKTCFNKNVNKLKKQFRLEMKR